MSTVAAPSPKAEEPVAAAAAVAVPASAPSESAPTTTPAAAAPPAAAVAAPTPPAPAAGGGAVAQAAAAQAAAAAGASPFHSASLYIGDLLPEVNEGLLFEIFNAVGPVASIRVCRDAVTRRSLGYAYVNYHQTPDAERALDSMNFTDIKGKPCRIMWSQRDPSVRRSGVGNIFVKNLHEGIDNKQLYDTFSLFANILSCKVVTDRETGKSKGYGYVHYETDEAAKNAIEKLDGMLIDGKEVQVGVFMRRNDRPGSADWTNCFIKNVPLDWTDANLREEFSKYGEIVSASISVGMRKKRPAKKPKAADKAKVDTEAAKKDDEPKGEDPAAVDKGEEDKTEAAAASEESNGGSEKPESDKENVEAEKEDSAEDKDAKPVEEKEAPAPVEEKEAPAPVEEKIMGSLGFAFVNYATHEAAVAAVQAMHEKDVKSVDEATGEESMKTLYVGRAQKKAERERELRAKYEAEKIDRIAKFQGVNLYVKNLDDAVTDDMLRDEFSAMGTITSARVMKDLKSGTSRGFGFVCYSAPEDATRAVNEMNGKLVASKPIFVALAQRREVRRAQLEAQHNQGRSNPPGQPGMMRGPMGGPMGGYPGAAAMPVYMQRPGPGSMQPSYPMVPQMMGGRGGGGAYGMQGPAGGRPGGYPMPGYGMMPAQPGRGGAGGRGPAGPGGRGRGGPQPGGRGHPGAGPGRGGAPVPGGRGGPHQPPIKFNQQARNAGPGGAPPAAGPVGVPPGSAPPAPNAPAPSQPPAQGGAPPSNSGGSAAAANEQLTPAALASASPEMQKNMIGERLYPLIHQTQPELAGKITGMLLEMDNSELLHLLESPEALNNKIQEALQVLEAHNSDS